tara:strand:- start:2797 stop:3636 length:840 start_codon:yes stop_codon:yes gene_type:complete
MSKVTFGFIVGGDDIYYKNLMRACESLERVKQPHEILIIDMDNRLSIDEPNIKIINAEAEKVENEDDRNYFQPHIWKKRYELYKHLETDYCFYMDTDTVVINDRTDELIEEAEDKFLCTQHWWVPTLQHFFATDQKISKINLNQWLPEDTGTYEYAASGAFLFQKEKHDGLFEKYNEIFTDVFSDGGLHSGVTDELILCLSLNLWKNYKFTNGSFNHCAAKKYMPMEQRDGTWYGSNPFETEMKPVFLFHSACQNVDTLDQYETDVEELKKVMYWEDYS